MLLLQLSHFITTFDNDYLLFYFIGPDIVKIIIVFYNIIYIVPLIEGNRFENAEFPSSGELLKKLLVP